MLQRSSILHLLLYTSFFFLLSTTISCKKEGGDYHRAAHDPIHFQPHIEQASDGQCLQCHGEILSRGVHKSPAGREPDSAFAWYQSLSTYEGEQKTFHQRHINSPLAKNAMNLKCNFCHRGHDPDQEDAVYRIDSSEQSEKPVRKWAPLRKQVDVEEVCLRCHGTFPFEVMGLEEDWPVSGELFGWNCYGCHSVIRSNRHNVTYLNKEYIEKEGRTNGDLCYGCHGGRAWYRASYPYPRHPWPGMGDQIPEGLENRPVVSEKKYRIIPEQSNARGDSPEASDESRK